MQGGVRQTEGEDVRDVLAGTYGSRLRVHVGQGLAGILSGSRPAGHPRWHGHYRSGDVGEALVAFRLGALRLRSVSTRRLSREGPAQDRPPDLTAGVEQ